MAEKTAAEIAEENRRAQLSKSEEAIAANDAAENAPKKKKKKVKKKVPEKIGVGVPSVSTADIVADLQSRIDATTNPDLIAKLKARQAAVKANAP